MGERWRWLGTPWFLVAVALLVLNDHVLKARFPGWWTGKVSDVAGVAVLGIVAAVLVGRGAGFAIVAVAFVALKVVPGVAELAAPVLGGPTRRDATDLIGLFVLIPLWPLLGSEPAPAGRSERLGWRAIGAAFFPVLGAVTALFATTATSCASHPVVTQLTADGTTFHAAVGGGWEAPTWAESTDGGLRWTAAEPPAGAVDPAAPAPRRDRRPPRLVVECSGTTCYRLRDGDTIERSTSGRSGPWVLEHRVTSAQRATHDGGCGSPPRGVMTTVVVAQDPSRAAVDYGAGGVLARRSDGSWSLRPVLLADNPEVEVAWEGWWRKGAVALVLLGGGLAAALGRRSPERWIGAALIVVGGIVYTGLVSGLVARDAAPVIGLAGASALAAFGVIATAGGLLSGFRSPRPDPLAAGWYPPPPPPMYRYLPPPQLPPPPAPPDATRPGSEGSGSSHDGGGRGI